MPRFGAGRPSQANAGAVSVTVSSCPTVSRPKASGMNAPIATTTKIVPKKIIGEFVYGSIRKGASTPDQNRPVLHRGHDGVDAGWRNRASHTATRVQFADRRHGRGGGDAGTSRPAREQRLR